MFANDFATWIDDEYRVVELCIQIRHEMKTVRFKPFTNRQNCCIRVWLRQIQSVPIIGTN
jgi:hypothetical protein